MLRVPKYRLHRARGTAFVQHWSIKSSDHRLYLGKYGTPESIEKYQAFLRDLANLDREDTEEEETVVIAGSYPTVEEVCAAYVKYAEKHYQREHGLSHEFNMMVDAIKPLVEECGDTIAKLFGPKRLKRVRRRLVKRKLARRTINHMVSRIKRIFRWASEEEIVPSHLYHRLTCVKGLYRGEMNCRDPKKVKPAPLVDIEALLPHLSPVVADMLRIQYWCDMRPAEVCIMRAVDIDMSGAIWLYRPHDHKTAWRECDQVKAIPPIAQVIIRKYLRPDLTAYLFSQTDTAAWRAEQRQANGKPRKTKRYPSEERRVQLKSATRVRRASRHADSMRFDTKSYYRAIGYGFKRAAKAGIEIDRFAPNQVRHSITTFVSQRLGQQAAQRYAGHSDLNTTNIYTENEISELVNVATQLNDKLPRLAV